MRNLLVMLALLALVSCGAGSSQLTGESDTSLLNAGVPSVGDLPVRGVSAYDSYVLGSEFLSGQNIAAADRLGVFTPTRVDGTGEYAYGLYSFGLDELEGNFYVVNYWENAPAAEDMWIGLPNRVNQSWDWFQPGPEFGVFVDNRETYLDESGVLFTVVLLDCSGEFSLDHLGISHYAPGVSAITPALVEPGDTVQFKANYHGCQPLEFSWDFGDMATPSTSTEEAPTVEITTTEGNYTVTVQFSNQLGGEPYEYNVSVKSWQVDLDVGELVVVPLKENAVVGEEVPVIVISGDFPEEAPIKYMNGIAITCEAGGDYVDGSFNIGHPGGVRSDWDGLWGAMVPVPSVPSLPQDFMMHAFDVYGEDNLVYMGFNITPVGGCEVTTGGVILNCCLAFDTPGTYHLGLIEFNDVKRTYYSDKTACEYFWLDIDNDRITKTIVVTAE